MTQAVRAACRIMLSCIQNTPSVFLSRSHLTLEVTPSISRKHFPNSQTSALVEPLSVAWHAVNRSPLQENDTVLIVGAGPIGLAIVQVLKARKIKTIVVVEISEQRRRFAQSFGATHALNPKDVDAVAEIQAITGDACGVSVSFECSGVQAGLDTALAGTRVRGTTVIVSLWEEKPSIDVFVNVVLAEKYITGAAVYDNEDFHAVIEAIASGETIHSITTLRFLERASSDAFL